MFVCVVVTIIHARNLVAIRKHNNNNNNKLQSAQADQQGSSFLHIPFTDLGEDTFPEFRNFGILPKLQDPLGIQSLHSLACGKQEKGLKKEERRRHYKKAGWNEEIGSTNLG